MDLLADEAAATLCGRTLWPVQKSTEAMEQGFARLREKITWNAFIIPN